MSSPEIPDEQPVFITPDFVPERYIDEERREHGNVLDDLTFSLGRVAQVSSESWPQSLHVVMQSEGEILIRSTLIKVGRRVGDCVNITVNQSKHMGAFGIHELDIHDFIVPCAFNAVSYRATRTHRNEEKAWMVSDETGPILQKRHDRLEECYGTDYRLPAVRRIADNKKSTLDLIDESLAAEKLIGWLSLCSQSSYDEYISREI